MTPMPVASDHLLLHAGQASAVLELLLGVATVAGVLLSRSGRREAPLVRGGLALVGVACALQGTEYLTHLPRGAPPGALGAIAQVLLLLGVGCWWLGARRATREPPRD